MNFRKIFAVVMTAVALITPSFAQSEIKVGKALQITIQGVPIEEQQKINGQYMVTDSGLISMPHLSPIRAVGMNPGSLANVIQSRYKSEGIYRNPTIQVFANMEGAGVDKQSVTVGGQVRRPGPVEYSRELTLYQAIQAAGGATEFGSLKRVVLFRNGQGRRYDVTQAQFMNIPLSPSDTIEVPQKTMLGQ
jgi:protein involved in polysaccharide export with SLBB domain